MKMVKFTSALLIVGLISCYGVKAQDITETDTASAVEATGVDAASAIDTASVVDPAGATDTGSNVNVDELGTGVATSGTDAAENGVESASPTFANRPHFGNPPPSRFGMPPRMSPRDIEKMTPQGNTRFFGKSASFSSSKKIVNGQIVDQQQSGQVVTNNNGEVEKQEFGNEK